MRTTRRHLAIVATAVLLVVVLLVVARAGTVDDTRDPDSPIAQPSVSSGASEGKASGVPRILQALTVAESHRGAPEYRRAQWEHWVDDDQDCQDTRQEVLIAESRMPVTFKGSPMCDVASGSWFDEYSGVILTMPGDVDVDHLVPLENAHISGGWQWSADQRRAFANDLSNPEHLIAVRDRVNQSKGSKSPERWMPPRVEYRCDYAISWIAVKTRWSLTVTADERSALLSLLNTCPPDRRVGW